MQRGSRLGSTCIQGQKAVISRQSAWYWVLINNISFHIPLRSLKVKEPPAPSSHAYRTSVSFCLVRHSRPPVPLIDLFFRRTTPDFFLQPPAPSPHGYGTKQTNKQPLVSKEILFINYLQFYFTVFKKAKDVIGPRQVDR
jgi:hypothetical protein